MRKSIILILIVLAIAFTGLYVASADSPGQYSITVTGIQNTVLTPVNVTFGEVSAGTNATINPTFTATNNGSLPATVDVKFVVNGTIYGFNGSAAYIDGDKVYMNHESGSWTQLTNTNTDTTLPGIVDHNSVPNNYGIEVRIPIAQAADAYFANIQVTFSG